MNKNRIRGLRWRASGRMTAKPISVSSLVVNPAVARRKRSNLPREICGMSQNVTEGGAIHSDRAVEVSKGRSTS